MMKALIFVSGVAVGFVVGARSGRETYEKMRDQSRQVWRSPAVQEKVSDAARVVKDAAPQVKQTVGALAKEGTHRDPDTGPGSAGAPNGSAASPGEAFEPAIVSPGRVDMPLDEG